MIAEISRKHKTQLSASLLKKKKELNSSIPRLKKIKEKLLERLEHLGENVPFNDKSTLQVKGQLNNTTVTISGRQVELASGVSSVAVLTRFVLNSNIVDLDEFLSKNKS